MSHHAGYQLQWNRLEIKQTQILIPIIKIISLMTIVGYEKLVLVVNPLNDLQLINGVWG